MENFTREDLVNMRLALNAHIHSLVMSAAQTGASMKGASELAVTRDKVQAAIDALDGINVTEQVKTGTRTRETFLRDHATLLRLTGNERDADYASECEAEADEIANERAHGPIDA
jgi:hypothetical protein